MTNIPPPRYVPAVEPAHDHPLPHIHPPRASSSTSLRAHIQNAPPHPSSAPVTPPRQHSHYTPPSHDTIQLPEWQPDDAAKACPICSSVFTWFNRRHHCRKCGRVVCAACSPHRITIPAAFVVKPPGMPKRGIEVIDLTSSPESGPSGSGRRWGTGGEDDEREGSEDVEEEEEDDDEDDEPEALQVRICEDCLLGRRPRVEAGRSGGRGGEGSSSVAVPNDRRRRQSIQGGRSLPPAHAPFGSHHGRARPQLAETDYCPICHRALPYIADPSEAGREAHIAACIEAATASPASPPPGPGVNKHGGRSRSYTNTGRMVVWRASAKDALDPSTGEPVECVICFEDFEEGQEIARLECLCRYHKKCIRDWFDKKGNGECPVHVVHE